MLGRAGDNTLQAVITNPTGVKYELVEGTVLGEAVPAQLVTGGADPPQLPCDHTAVIKKVRSGSDVGRRQRLEELVVDSELLDGDGKRRLAELLENHHTVFCLEEWKRGETDLVEMRILTGDSVPKRLPLRRMPSVVRQEVARQLKRKQEDGIIQPSSSPWANPVVMVRKDGSHRFCVDYQALNTARHATSPPSIWPRATGRSGSTRTPGENSLCDTPRAL